MHHELVLELSGVSRQFGAVRALTSVSFDCRAGEVHALVGENGSGKSTLLGIASGFVDPDRGTVRIGGRPLPRDSPALSPQARPGHGLPGRLVGPGRAGEEQPLLRRGRGAPALPAPEEVGAPGPRRLRPRPRAVPRRPGGLAHDGGASAVRGGQSARDRTQGAAARRAHDRARPRGGRGPPPNRPGVQASRCRRGLRQPSAAGSARDRRPDHGAPRRATSRNLRRRHHDGTGAGRARSSVARSRRPSRHGSASSEAEDVLVVDALQGQTFGPVSFTLRSGEVVGIAGAEGNGQPQLFDCLAGRIPPRAGRVVCRGKELTLISTREAVGAGIMLLPGDRKREALMGVLGVRVNATVQSLRRFSRFGLLRRRAERAAVQARRAARDPHPVARSAGRVPVRRQPAEGLRRPIVPQGAVGDPGLRTHPRCRRRLPHRHLQRASYPCRRRCRPARQVERPDRTLGSL